MPLLQATRTGHHIRATTFPPWSCICGAGRTQPDRKRRVSYVIVFLDRFRWHKLPNQSLKTASWIPSTNGSIGDHHRQNPPGLGQEAVGCETQRAAEICRRNCTAQRCISSLCSLRALTLGMRKSSNNSSKNRSLFFC